MPHYLVNHFTKKAAGNNSHASKHFYLYSLTISSYSSKLVSWLKQQVYVLFFIRFSIYTKILVTLRMQMNFTSPKDYSRDF